MSSFATRDEEAQAVLEKITAEAHARFQLQYPDFSILGTRAVPKNHRMNHPQHQEPKTHPTLSMVKRCGGCSGLYETPGESCTFCSTVASA